MPTDLEAPLFALLRRATTPRRTVESFLGNYELPGFSAVALRVLRQLRDPSENLRVVGDTLSADPGLSITVLKLVNSPSYACKRQVRSVPHAVMLLGRSEVECVVLAAATKSTLPGRPQLGFEPQRFWRAAARRAALARGLASILHPATSAEAFTAGLLQDMALPLLATSDTARYSPVLVEWHSGDASLHALERDRFGWDHAEVAGSLCERWGFPAGLAQAIADHHDAPGEGNFAAQLVSLVRESDLDAATDAIVEAARSAGARPDRVVDAIAAAAIDGDDLAALLR